LALVRESCSICSFSSFFFIRHLEAASLFFSRDSCLRLSTSRECRGDFIFVDDWLDLRLLLILAESLCNFGGTDAPIESTWSRLLLATGSFLVHVLTPAF
jgi:hypothetical protein